MESQSLDMEKQTEQDRFVTLLHSHGFPHSPEHIQKQRAFATFLQNLPGYPIGFLERIAQGAHFITREQFERDFLGMLETIEEIIGDEPWFAAVKDRYRPQKEYRSSSQWILHALQNPEIIYQEGQAVAGVRPPTRVLMSLDKEPDNLTNTLRGNEIPKGAMLVIAEDWTIHGDQLHDLLMEINRSKRDDLRVYAVVLYGTNTALQSIQEYLDRSNAHGTIPRISINIVGNRFGSWQEYLTEEDRIFLQTVDMEYKRSVGNATLLGGWWSPMQDDIPKLFTGQTILRRSNGRFVAIPPLFPTEEDFPYPYRHTGTL